MEILRQLAVNYSFYFIGLAYNWGGDDPMSGFDCSGFVNEVLKSVGKIERHADFTAEDLSKKWIQIDKPQAGVLAFWKNKEGTKVIHVELCINEFQTIGASGGGSSTTNEQEASKINAFIKVRPIRGGAFFVDPFAL